MEFISNFKDVTYKNYLILKYWDRLYKNRIKNKYILSRNVSCIFFKFSTLIYDTQY